MTDIKDTSKAMTAEKAVRHEREPIEHELKTWQSYFHALVAGTKTFEIRRDDRDFRVGDTLRLRETEYSSGNYTGREERRTISYILRREPEFGLADGFAILGFSIDAQATEITALRAELATARESALEEAAKLCEQPYGTNRGRENARGRGLAKKLRALKGQTP